MTNLNEHPLTLQPDLQATNSLFAASVADPAATPPAATTAAAASSAPPWPYPLWPPLPAP
uniref:Uncharacterized protein n=1 Tax=Tetranychus urticae TaxID=32264 RepID=T1KF39_TETUR